MNDHRAWKTPLSIGIEHSMRESDPFIDLISDAGPSKVNEEPEEEDEEARLARKYACFIRNDPL
jgi:hypothetical protein